MDSIRGAIACHELAILDMLESDQDINCPYCAAVISIRVDQTAGNRQFFVTDCEVCCRPIEIELDIDSEGTVNLIAKREGEG